jgi:hypothetical protein
MSNPNLDLVRAYVTALAVALARDEWPHIDMVLDRLGLLLGISLADCEAAEQLLYAECDA